ncbi:MAG: hypothetical protein AAB421_04230 [Patescibacteria group bacterium]
MDWKLSGIFGNGQWAKDHAAVEKMNEEIRKVGGILHFAIEKEVDGWHAECKEIPGIITGGNRANPTQEEIESRIRDAIHAVFDITPTNREIGAIRNADAPAYRLCPA